LDLEGLAEDPSFESNEKRVANRVSLSAILGAATRSFSRDDLLARLEKAAVPAGPINTVADVFADPQVVARKLRIDTPHSGAVGGTTPGIRTPIRFSRSTLSLSLGVPRLGQHQDDSGWLARRTPETR
jgi:crotonobetainyl-CoA:carnitine CoA-transferase CaiB-like acyl-CoA transferase